MSIWGQTVTKVFQEMKFLKDVFIAHAGNSSNSAATASSTFTSAVSGEAPSGLTASGSGSGEVKSEQPDDFLNDLLAQLDPPPGPS